jgi:Terminase large subunit, T4likevirus-type, N-terminal
MWLGLFLEISIALLPHQMEAMQSTSRIVALTGGYGCGKSSTCALLGVHHAMIDPCLHGIVSPSYPQAKLSIIPSVFEVLEDWMGFKEGKQFTYNRTEHIFRFPRWKSELVILSGENPKRLKGPNLGSCGMDEPGVMDHVVFKQITARVRHPKAKRPQVYLTGTPEDLNWYSDLVEGELKPPGLHDIRAKTRDNTFLSEDFFKSLEESYSEAEIAAYMNGQFVNLNSAMAAHAYSQANIIEPSEYQLDPSLPLLIGFDYNWSPNVAVIAQEVPDWVEFPGAEPSPKLIVFDEFWALNCSTEKKCESIIEKYGPDLNYQIYQDATGDGRHGHGVGISDSTIVRNAFKGINHRLNFNPTNPKRINRLNSVNGRLSNSKGTRFIYITRNCKRLIDDLRKCGREEYLLTNYQDPDRGHIFDAFGYLVSYRYPVLRKTNHSNKALVL